MTYEQLMSVIAIAIGETLATMKFSKEDQNRFLELMTMNYKKHLKEMEKHE